MTLGSIATITVFKGDNVITVTPCVPKSYMISLIFDLGACSAITNVTELLNDLQHTVRV